MGVVCRRPISLAPLLSRLSRSGSRFCTIAPMYCACRRSVASRRPQPFSLIGSRKPFFAMGLQEVVHSDAHLKELCCGFIDLLHTLIPYCKYPVSNTIQDLAE